VVSTTVSRSEKLKRLHLGLISEAKRKPFPSDWTVAGLDNAQSLHHFLTESPWQIDAFRQHRLKLILQTLGEREIVLVIDDTGDRKKGHHTDYVKRQYIGNLGKIENGIVVVTAESSRALRFLCSSRSTNPKNDSNQRISTAASQKLQQE